MITQERLKELLDYDETTGIFTNRIARGKCKVGKQSGWLDKDGYLIISLDDINYRAPRLARFYIYGVWPNQVDHINGIRYDNRSCNLRDVTSSGNNQNRHAPQPINSTGFLGVSLFRNKFRARIKVNNKEKHLGLFKTKEEAHQAYLTAKRELHITCTI